MKSAINLFKCLFLFLPVIGISQINSSIDILVGLDYSYRSLSTESSDATTLDILENLDAVEEGKINWRGGFNYNKRLSNKIFLKAGLRLASIGYKGEKFTDLRWGSEYDGMGGWAGPDPNLAHEIQAVNDYWFTELPIAIRYEFNEKKLSPFLELGVSPSLYLTTKESSLTDIGNESSFSKNENPDFNKLQVAGIISAGVNYSISENLQLFSQLAYRRHLTQLETGTIEENLYNYGIEIGARKRIN